MSSVRSLHCINQSCQASRTPSTGQSKSWWPPISTVCMTLLYMMSLSQYSCTSIVRHWIISRQTRQNQAAELKLKSIYCSLLSQRDLPLLHFIDLSDSLTQANFQQDDTLTPAPRLTAHEILPEGSKSLGLTCKALYASSNRFIQQHSNFKPRMKSLLF